MVHSAHIRDPGLPGAPRVRVIGFAMMGGVDVRRKPMKRRGNGEQGTAIESDRRGQIDS